MNVLNFQQIIIFMTFCQVLCEVNTVNDSSDNVVAGANIYKCICKMNEAIKNGTCVPSVNHVQVWDYIKQRDLAVDISKFASVTINAVQCQRGFTKLTLKNSHFVIYTNGLFDNLLLVDESPTPNYCIDYILSDNGIDIYAEVCERNPVVSMCCPSGYSLNNNGKCVLSKDVPFQPPLIGDFIWSGYNTSEQAVTCGDKELLRNDLLTYPHEIGASLVSNPIGTKLQWSPIDGLPHYFSNDEYCISAMEYNNEWIYVAQFCIADQKLLHIETCSNITCVRKCCPYNYIYEEQIGNCVPYFDFQIQYEFIDNDEQTIPDPADLQIMFGLPHCEEGLKLPFQVDNGSDIIQFYPNGSLVTKGLGTYSPLQYCVEGHVYDLLDENRTIQSTAFVCLKGLEDPCAWRWIIGSVLLSISCLFYILTLVVYIVTDELRSKMVGKCLISQVSALLIAYLTLIFLQNNDNYSHFTCNFPGTVEHIAILASFFWLNVMCFDMWSKIRKIQVPRSNSSGSKRFVLYCIYAWGVPLLIGILRVVIDHLPEDVSHEWLIRSYLGKTHCFFSGERNPVAKWLYLYGPILILLLMNLFFFVHVAMIIMKTKKEAEKLLTGTDSSKTGTNLNDKKERAMLYLKLFLVMGISWLLEIIMWVAVKENDCAFWGLDIVNMFQGVFIFLIFVCKRSTLKLVKERFLCRPPPKREQYSLTEPEKSREELNNIVA